MRGSRSAGTVSAAPAASIDSTISLTLLGLLRITAKPSRHLDKSSTAPKGEDSAAKSGNSFKFQPRVRKNWSMVIFAFAAKASTSTTVKSS